MGKDDIDRHWENRVLCSDESCIGVIGSNRRCKVCGRVFEGKLPADFNPDESGVYQQDKRTTDPEAMDDACIPDEQQAMGAEATDDEWSQRTLCSDESCIGVIGPDGRCKECGNPFQDS
jgi:hypothetical protein